MERETGTVLFFATDKGFGFAAPEGVALTDRESSFVYLGIGLAALEHRHAR